MGFKQRNVSKRLITCYCFSEEVHWKKLECTGDYFPKPRSQHVAVADADKKRIFVFGGYANEATCLNDCWLFEIKNNVWKRVDEDKDVEDSQESRIGMPAPRANAGHTLYKNKVFIYGGHSAPGYAPVSFQDIWSFDLVTQ